MATAVRTSETQLPKEMMAHTYPVFYEVEGSHWWYVGRRKIIAGFLKDLVAKLGRRPTIVDIGSGTGMNVLLLQEYGDVTGVDVSQDAIDFCRKRGLENIKLGSAEEIPLEDGVADIVTAFDVVEHLDDDLAGLKEFRRVLKPDGRMLLFVPTFMFLWGVQDDVSNHRRRYTLPGLLKVVREAGFEVERSTYINITFFMPIMLVRWFLRVSGIRPETELKIGPSAFNGFFAAIFGAESDVLRYTNLPFGVSGVCVARKI